MIINLEYFKTFNVRLSDKGSNTREEEEQTCVFFFDFLDECEGMSYPIFYYCMLNFNAANEVNCTLRDVLVFLFRQ